ncbi:MAG: hypothetical protein P9M15_08195 [Candidatus Electryoneaceae bacterium]|nr:hypothetical protein [Candidatus Electryoneaceae bacterium]
MWKHPYCLLLVILFFFQFTDAQSKKYYFFHPENRFGSDLAFNPANVFINGSFDILRNGGHDKNIFRQSYKIGWENVWYNISDPISNIEEYGWHNFLERECFNLTLNSSKGQFIPNITTHLIGNGMLYVMMAEWYDYHHVKFPYLTSIVTTTLYQVLNEVVENSSYRGLNPDPISDLLIYNPLGIILFSTEFGKRLFSESFPLYNWSLQPVIDPRNGRLENAGQQYCIKWKIPFSERYSLFFYWGINGLGGITYSRDNVHNYSFGLATVANKLNEKRLNGARFLTPTMDGAVGFFYDKKHSLMWSVIMSGPRMYNARINIYPGVLHNQWYTPGVYIGFGEWDKFICGFSISHLPLGLAAGRK